MSTHPPSSTTEQPHSGQSAICECGHSILEDHNETFGCHNRDADDFGCTCTRKASEIVNALSARVAELEAALKATTQRLEDFKDYRDFLATEANEYGFVTASLKSLWGAKDQEALTSARKLERRGTK